jgi:hypothetical protein
MSMVVVADSLLFSQIPSQVAPKSNECDFGKPSARPGEQKLLNVTRF